MTKFAAINLKASPSQVRSFLLTVEHSLEGLPLANVDYLALREAVSHPQHHSEGSILIVKGRNASALADRLGAWAKARSLSAEPCKPRVEAEAYSDDRAFEIKFNAADWFETATDGEIVALAACDWGGDYAADAVAVDLADTNKDLAAMFSYLERIQDRPDKKDAHGFECRVDGDSALAWLRLHRPELASRMKLETAEALSEESAPSSPKKLWLVIVGHDEVPGVQSQWFWQALEPTDVEVVARYKETMPGELHQIRTEMLLDMTESIQKDPHVAAALAEMRNQKAAPAPKAGS